MNRADRFPDSLRSLVVSRRLGQLIGLAGLLAGAARYRSFENRVVLERYSPAFAGILVVIAVALLLMIVRSALYPR